MQILSVLKLKLQKKIIKIGNIVKKLSDLFRRCSKINKYIAFIFVLCKLLNDCRFPIRLAPSTSRAVLPPDSFFHCNILSYIFRLNIGFLLFRIFYFADFKNNRIFYKSVFMLYRNFYFRYFIRYRNFYTSILPLFLTFCNTHPHFCIKNPAPETSGAGKSPISVASLTHSCQDL